MRTLTLAAATLLAALPVAGQAVPPPAAPTAEVTAHVLELGTRAVDAFFAGEVDSLLAMMTASLVESLGGADGVRKIMDQVAEVGGMPLDVLERKVVMIGGHPTFWWEAEFSAFTAEPVVFLWTFDDDGHLSAFDADPKSQVEATPGA